MFNQFYMVDNPPVLKNYIEWRHNSVILGKIPNLPCMAENHSLLAHLLRHCLSRLNETS